MIKNLNWKRIRKIFFYVLLACVLIVGLVIWFSPYGYHKGFKYKLVKNTVIIHAGPEKVFNYLGNSDNARDWSVFVDHISPLPNGKKDGSVGSVRRCFCNANEKGTQWDEEITIVEPNKRRQLRIYNLVDFTASAEGLGTEQLYRKLGENKTELTFTVFYLKNDPSMWDEIKTYFAAYKMKSIFEANMLNIKKFVEQKN